MSTLTANGPAEFPTNSEFAGANNNPGPEFGDKTPRNPPSGGQSLAMGLSECSPFNSESPESLGMGRNVSTGKPDGPMKGPADNGGAGAKVQWG